MLVGGVGGRPVADDEGSAAKISRLVTMFDALLEEASQWFLDEGLSRHRTPVSDRL